MNVLNRLEIPFSIVKSLLPQFYKERSEMLLPRFWGCFSRGWWSSAVVVFRGSVAAVCR